MLLYESLVFDPEKAGFIEAQPCFSFGFQESA